MELTVVVTRESGAFWSQVVELPGCFASGRTVSELGEALSEAVGLYLWDRPAMLRPTELREGETTVEACPAP